MERDFELFGKSFKLNKIDPFKQFHIVRRIGPILGDVMPAMKGISKFKDDDVLSQEEKFEKIAVFVTPIMNGLSKLSDSDAELVLFGLLQSVEMKQPAGNWAKIANHSMLFFQDLSLPILLQIAGRAFAYNLTDFFAVLP